MPHFYQASLLHLLSWMPWSVARPAVESELSLSRQVRQWRMIRFRSLSIKKAPGAIPTVYSKDNSEQSGYFAQTGALWHSLNLEARKRIIQGLSSTQCDGIIWRAQN